MEPPAQSLDLKNTKQSATFISVSLFLLILFAISPLKHFSILSMIVKLGVLALLFVTIFINYNQINTLKTYFSDTNNERNQHIHSNIYQTYALLGLLVVLCIYVFISLLY